MYHNLSPRTTRYILTALVTLCLCTSQAWAAKSKYEAGAVSNGGSIKGTIKAAAKADETVPITKDNSFCGDSLPAEKYIIGSDGGLKNAVVKLEGITAGKAFDLPDPKISNTKCQFAPHVSVAQKKGMMVVDNQDPLLHNSHFYLVRVGKKNKNVINVALPKQGMELTKKKILKKAGLLSLQCDAHDFMQAYIWVLEHPYGVVTGSDGSFELTDVPAGSYKMTIWHEGLGEKVVDVTVEAGKATTIDHSF